MRLKPCAPSPANPRAACDPRHGIDRGQRLWWKPLSQPCLRQRHRTHTDTELSRCASSCHAPPIFRNRAVASRGRRSNGRLGSPAIELHPGSEVTTTQPLRTHLARLCLPTARASIQPILSTAVATTRPQWLKSPFRHLRHPTTGTFVGLNPCPTLPSAFAAVPSQLGSAFAAADQGHESVPHKELRHR